MNTRDVIKKRVQALFGGATVCVSLALLLCSDNVYAKEDNLLGLVSPRVISVDTKNNLLYAVEAFSGRIAVFDTEVDRSADPLYVYKNESIGAYTAVTDSSTSLTYAVTLRPKRVHIFDGSAIRKGIRERLGTIEFSAEDQRQMKGVNVVPAGDGKHIFLIISGSKPHVAIASPSGDISDVVELTSSPLDVSYNLEMNTLFVSYGAGFPVVDSIAVTTREKKTFSLSHDAGQIALNSAGTVLAVADALGSRMTMLDARRGIVKKTIELPHQAYMLGSTNGDYFYTGNYFFNSITRIDSQGDIKSIPLAVNPIAVQSLDGEMVAVLGHTGSLEIINFEDMKVLHTMITGTRRYYVFNTFHAVSPITYDTGGRRMYIVNEYDDSILTVSVNNTSANVLGKFSKEGRVIAHPVGGGLWNDRMFAANFDGRMIAYETTSGKMILERTVADKGLDDTILLDGRLFAVSGAAQELYVVNPHDFSVQEKIPLTALGGKDNRLGPLILHKADERQNVFSIHDEMSGAWAFFDVAENRIIANGKDNGLAGVPILIENGVARALFEQGVLVLSGISGNMYDKRVTFPDGYKPVFISYDNASRIIVFAVNAVRDASIFIVGTDGSISASFPVGRGVRAKVAGATGFPADVKTVLHAFYNSFDRSIWVVQSGSIAVYSSDGTLRKTISFSPIVSQLTNVTVTNGALVLASVYGIQVFDLATGIAVHEWEFAETALSKSVINGRTITRVSYDPTMGIVLTLQYDVMPYYDAKHDAWKSIFNETRVGAPSSLIREEDGTETKKSFFWIIAPLFFIIGAGIIIILWKKNRTYANTGTV